jgi:hypothetical protein
METVYVEKDSPAVSEWTMLVTNDYRPAAKNLMRREEKRSEKSIWSRAQPVMGSCGILSHGISVLNCRGRWMVGWTKSNLSNSNVELERSTETYVEQDV